MGLDVSAYSQVALIAKEGTWEGDWDSHWGVGCDHLYSSPADFPHAAPDFVDGVYSVGPGARLYFRAGSYRGYNVFRELLAKVAGVGSPRTFWQVCEGDPGAVRKVPFGEILNFADNEGVITDPACQGLASDFLRHRDDFADACRLDSYSLRTYDNFTAAFIIARGGGVVKYH